MTELTILSYKNQRDLVVLNIFKSDIVIFLKKKVENFKFVSIT